MIKQDLGEVWHTFCVRIIKKNEMARYKVGFSGPHTLRTVSAELICLPHLHGGPEEIRSSVDDSGKKKEKFREIFF